MKIPFLPYHIVSEKSLEDIGDEIAERDEQIKARDKRNAIRTKVVGNLLNKNFVEKGIRGIQKRKRQAGGI